MSEFCVIGSGISGATIANLLNKKNSVILFDKARGPGGRASFKRMKGNIGFDHGTQYFSPKTPEFKKFTRDLIKKKILKVWGGKHVFLNSQKKENKKHLKIIGKNGNNDISKYLLKKVKCNYQSELKKIRYKNKLWHLSFADGKLRSFKSIILTCPFPQLKKLSKKFIKNSFLKKSIKMDANITTMIAIKKIKNQIAATFSKIQSLVGLVMKIQKKDLNQYMIYGPFKVPFSGQIKRSIKIKEIRKIIQKL